MPNLESRSEPTSGQIIYNVSDLIVLFKALRHVPEALRQKDRSDKYRELILNGVIVGSSLLPYYSLYSILTS